eukprot:767277-Hanusia_phi.AAC.8
MSKGNQRQQDAPARSRWLGRPGNAQRQRRGEKPWGPADAADCGSRRPQIGVLTRSLGRFRRLSTPGKTTTGPPPGFGPRWPAVGEPLRNIISHRAVAGSGAASRGARSETVDSVTRRTQGNLEVPVEAREPGPGEKHVRSPGCDHSVLMHLSAESRNGWNTKVYCVRHCGCVLQNFSPTPERAGLYYRMVLTTSNFTTGRAQSVLAATTPTFSLHDITGPQSPPPCNILTRSGRKARTLPAVVGIVPALVLSLSTCCYPLKLCDMASSQSSCSSSEMMLPSARRSFSFSLSFKSWYSAKSSSHLDSTPHSPSKDQAWKELGKRHMLRVHGCLPDEIDVASDVSSTRGCFAWVKDRKRKDSTGISLSDARVR